MKPFYLFLAASLSLMAASPTSAQESQPYPSSADLVSHWASEFVRKGMTADAIETAGINVRNFPANAWAYAGLGDTYRAKGDKVAAIASYRTAVKLDALLPMSGRE